MVFRPFRRKRAQQNGSLWVILGAIIIGVLTYLEVISPNSSTSGYGLSIFLVLLGLVYLFDSL